MSEIPKEELERIEKEGMKLYPIKIITKWIGVTEDVPIESDQNKHDRNIYSAGAKAEHSHLLGRIEEKDIQIEMHLSAIETLRNEAKELQGRIAAIDPNRLRHLAAWLTLAEEKIHVNDPDKKSTQDTLREYADIIEKIQNP